MPTARTRKLAAALTALLISNAVTSRASATENAFTASPVEQQRSAKGDKRVGDAAAIGVVIHTEVCVETSIRRYDPYSERIITVSTREVCR